MLESFMSVDVISRNVWLFIAPGAANHFRGNDEA